MKTFQQFQEQAQLAIPLVRAAAPYVLPALGAVFAASKQGEGKRSQPVDYGQGGEATPRTPNVQRPSTKTTAARTQAQVAADDRRAAAKERAEAKAKAKIDSLIGSDEERAAAAKARALQPKIQQQLRRQATARRMSQAADKLGLPEQMTAPKLIDKHILDTRTTKEKQKEIKIEADLLPYNSAIGDRYKTR